MTKRFTINGREIIQDKQVWCMANSEHCADVIATAMNELHEETQHKQKLLHSTANQIQNLLEENQQLKNEIENLKQGLIHAAFDKEWK